MIGTKKLEYSLHQAPALEALSRRLQDKSEKLAPDNKPQLDTEQEILSDNEGIYPELGGSVCIEGDIE